jgi:uncharacterized SAM-binding protein YcdF (DUF218 family)
MVVVKIIKFILENMLSPVGIVSGLFNLCLVMSIHRNWRRVGNRLLIIGACLFIVLCCTPIVELLFSQLELQFSPLLDMSIVGDVRSIVVLSSYGRNSSETPITSNLSEETVYRLVEGIRLYRLIPGSVLIVSGEIVREGDPPIAQLMGEFLISMGVSQERHLH